MRFALLALLSVGCRQLLGFDSVAPTASCTVSCGTDGECPDSLVCRDELCVAPGAVCPMIDAGTGDAAPGFCAGNVGAPLGQLCFDPPPEPVIVSGLINTDMDVACSQRTIAGVPVCLLIVDTVGSTLRFTGSRMPVLWSSTSITVSALIDVASSNVSAFTGAGGNSERCTPSNAMNGVRDPIAGEFGSGGAGGSFGARGGNGGDYATGVAGGTTVAQLGGVQFQGGCKGGIGSGGVVTLQNAGHGGGGIYLIAHDTIAITAAGRINASGGGAFGSAAKMGGAGGGSGGMIVLDAATVTLESGTLLLALGGSGSSGGSSTDAGNAGKDPSLDIPFAAQPASTPSGCLTTGNGGAGSLGNGFPAQKGYDSPSSSCAPGGGGGGDGVILSTFAPDDQGAEVLPPIIVNQ